ncbi:DUF4279 domain-containing protein [Bradyrhizobium sp.]|uniref:DUF4279 domain-containing protein n=1 Tax=Bradyrhizobium sp. TaxID=376 RepID=UPI002613A971|nr:DUF4279 domain-containing protein [Bradyrhizobium sp.]
MEVDDDNYFASNETLRYNVRFIIRHPAIDPDVITRTLQIEPTRAAMVGSFMKTPKGETLQGRHRDSVWSCTLRLARNRFFFREVVDLIEKLEPHKAFLVDLIESGGEASVNIDLPGDTNIGDILPWREVARLGALRIELGIEVFPEFN